MSKSSQPNTTSIPVAVYDNRDFCLWAFLIVTKWTAFTHRASALPRSLDNFSHTSQTTTTTIIPTGKYTEGRDRHYALINFPISQYTPSIGCEREKEPSISSTVYHSSTQSPHHIAYITPSRKQTRPGLMKINHSFISLHLYYKYIQYWNNTALQHYSNHLTNPVRNKQKL